MTATVVSTREKADGRIAHGRGAVPPIGEDTLATTRDDRYRRPTATGIA